jgi:threonine-phosphate decarboxylase
VALAELGFRSAPQESGRVTFVHGGDVERIARDTGIAADRFLDFSANVNPIGLPARAVERLAQEAADPRSVARYPDPEGSELRCVLSRQLDVPAGCIVIGAGADALIHAAVRALRPQRCLIPTPAFSEYERACLASGCPTCLLPLPPDFRLDLKTFETIRPGDLVIINNPHNPSGVCASREEMLDRIAAARSSGAAVLADEAFIDYSPEDAITRDVISEVGVVAIRSLTKFFGCPGLRVGYAVADPETADQLTAQLPAWPVTTLALGALAEALRDTNYAAETRERNRHARERLATALSALGCQAFRSSANFLLLQLPDCFFAPEIRERLIWEHAILVRGCDSFHAMEGGNYLRVAVRLEDENARLIDALAKILRGS